jgi:hypothetical protein
MASSCRFLKLELTPCSFGLSATNHFVPEDTSHQQPTNSIFLSEQISTSHQPNKQAKL